MSDTCCVYEESTLHSEFEKGQRNVVVSSFQHSSLKGTYCIVYSREFSDAFVHFLVVYSCISQHRLLLTYKYITLRANTGYTTSKKGLKKNGFAVIGIQRAYITKKKE